MPLHGCRYKMSTILPPNGTSGTHSLEKIEIFDSTLESLLSDDKLEHPPTYTSEALDPGMNCNLVIDFTLLRPLGTPGLEENR